MAIGNPASQIAICRPFNGIRAYENRDDMRSAPEKRRTADRDRAVRAGGRERGAAEARDRTNRAVQMNR